MIFSYNWLQSFFKNKLPNPEKLAELLTMHFFEVEEVKRKGKDWVLDIDILPSRGSDCFSHLGVARECAVIAGSKFQAPSFKLKEDGKIKAKDFVTVEKPNKLACFRYTARVVTDVKVSSSPKWLKDRLKLCGLRPINNIVDIANYVMLETGQPLHVFDVEKLEGRKIIVRFAKERERIVTLDEEKYNLNKDILVIADSKKPAAIAGIKGGKIPEVDNSTKTVVVESANFNPKVIRKSSRKLNLRTDASIRFEHGIDPNLTEPAIARVCYLMQKITGGKIAQGLIDFYPKKTLSKRVRLDLDYVERLLGDIVPEKEIKNILKRLDFEVKKVSSSTFLVEIPTRRLDISLPEDLIEEIGRIYGYEKVKPIFPEVSLIPPKRNLNFFWEGIIKNILKEGGFTEVYNYSFISENDAKTFGYSPTKPSTRTVLVEVENPMSIEQKYLRPSLIPNLLKNVKTNLKQYNKIKIFELGKIFINKQRTADNGQLEKRMLTGLITGDAFYQAKGVVDLLLKKLGISNIWYDQYQPTPEESKISIWHPKRRAEIKIDHEEIGFLGEISPRVLEDLKIPARLVVFDLDFEILSTLASEEHEYMPIARYPAAVRDLAVLVQKGVKVVDVLNKINAAGGPLIRDIDLFDVYEGTEIPRGKKNLAFHIIYQAEDRTLSSKEIDEIQNKVIKALESEVGWEVRR